MTTATMEYRPSRAPLGIILTALLIALAALILYSYGQQGGAQPKPIAQPIPEHVDNSKSHALESHPKTAPKARKCLDDKGKADAVFKEHSDEFGWMWHLLCQGPDGKWYERLIYQVKETFYERTAFGVNEKWGGTTEWSDVLKRFGSANKSGNWVTKTKYLPWK
jgi:hypothetical protein